MAYDGRMLRVLDEVEKGIEFAALDVDWGIDWAEIVKRKIEQQSRAQDDNKHNTTTTAAADAVQERAVILAAGVHNGVTNRLRYITQRNHHGMSSGKEVQIALPTAEDEDGDGVEQQLLRHAVLTHLVIDRQRRLVIASTSHGHVLLLSYPVQTETDPRIHLLSATALHDQHCIAHMVYLPIAGTIITVGSDGNTLVSDIRALDQSSYLSARHSAPQRATSALPAPFIASSPIPAFQLTPPRFLPRILPAPVPIKSTTLTPFTSHSYASDLDVIQLRLSDYRHLLSLCKSSEAAIRKIEKTAEYQFSAPDSLGSPEGCT